MVGFYLLLFCQPVSDSLDVWKLWYPCEVLWEIGCEWAAEADGVSAGVDSGVLIVDAVVYEDGLVWGEFVFAVART